MFNLSNQNVCQKNMRSWIVKITLKVYLVGKKGLKLYVLKRQSPRESLRELVMEQTMAKDI